MILINGLTKHYGKQKVLNGVSAEFSAGQSIALVGPNGSGKTTLIKAILGLVNPGEGAILVNGQNISDGCLYRREIGYMSQNSRFPENLTVSQLFAMMRKMRPGFPDAKLDWQLYESFDLAKVEGKFLGALSGGMKQQVSAALAFLFSPSIIILDEPTAGLDPVSNELLKQKLRLCRTENKLILVTSHILNDLDEITDHVLYLMSGEVILFEETEKLMRQTSETQLNKIIVTLINREFAYVKG